MTEDSLIACLTPGNRHARHVAVTRYPIVGCPAGPCKGASTEGIVQPTDSRVESFEPTLKVGGIPWLTGIHPAEEALALHPDDGQVGNQARRPVIDWIRHIDSYDLSGNPVPALNHEGRETTAHQ